MYQPTAVSIEAVARALGQSTEAVESAICELGYLPGPVVGIEMYEQLAKFFGPAPESAGEPAPPIAEPVTAATSAVSFMPGITHKAKLVPDHTRGYRCQT